MVQMNSIESGAQLQRLRCRLCPTTESGSSRRGAMKTRGKVERRLLAAWRRAAQPNRLIDRAVREGPHSP
jgi:hypothetical protein